MNIRPLTREDLVGYWHMEDIGRSVRGFVAEKDGEVLGMTGLIYMAHSIIAFAEMKEGGQQYPLSIMRITRMMQGLMRGINAPIFAVADEQYPNSRAFLERVGFEQVAGRQYCFKNGRT